MRAKSSKQRCPALCILELDVHFPEENNMGLLPIPFYHHFPLHTFKVTDIFVKLNRMQCKQSDFVS